MHKIIGKDVEHAKYLCTGMPVPRWDGSKERTAYMKEDIKKWKGHRNWLNVTCLNCLKGKPKQEVVYPAERALLGIAGENIKTGDLLCIDEKTSLIMRLRFKPMRHLLHKYKRITLTKIDDNVQFYIKRKV